MRRSTLAEANIRCPQEFFAKFLAEIRPSKSYKGNTNEPKDREKEKWYESTYSNEVSCRRANGRTTHFGIQTRSLSAQGGASVQRFHFVNG